MYDLQNDKQHIKNTCRCITRIFVGEREGMWEVKVQVSRGVFPCENLENMHCLRLHFAHFHGGERKFRVGKRRSKSQPLDLLRIYDVVETTSEYIQ